MQERIKEVEVLEKQVDSTEEELFVKKLLEKSMDELENLETVRTIILMENEALMDKNIS